MQGFGGKRLCAGGAYWHALPLRYGLDASACPQCAHYALAMDGTAELSPAVIAKVIRKKIDIDDFT